MIYDERKCDYSTPRGNQWIRMISLKPLRLFLSKLGLVNVYHRYFIYEIYTRKTTSEYAEM